MLTATKQEAQAIYAAQQLTPPPVSPDRPVQQGGKVEVKEAGQNG